MNELAKFDPVLATIEKYRAMNAEVIFDYEDPQDNKDARSHVYKLRQVKTEIARIHKIIKAGPFKLCQEIDDKKREYTAVVEEMIDVHAKRIKEIEDREAKAAAEKAEAERVEAERIEAKRVADIERRETELAAKEQAAKDEATRLVREAERLEAAKRAKADAQRREKEARERAILQAETEKKDAAEKAEREKREAIEAEKQRIEAEHAKKEQVRLALEAAERLKQQQEAAAEKRRIENKKHRTKVENQAQGGIVKITQSEKLAAQLMVAIRDGNIPNVTLNY